MDSTEEHTTGARSRVDGVTRGTGIRRRLLADLPVTERRVPAAGVDTAVIEGGQGPPLLLLQGEFAVVWVPVLDALTATHRVVVPDLPGLGESRAPEHPLDLEGLVAWLDEVVARTCDAPPVVVGKGAGGALAARLAVERPEALARLVLVDSQGLERFRPPLRQALSFAGVLLRPTERRIERSFGAYCFVDLPAVHEQLGEQWEQIVAYALEGFRASGTKTAMRRLMPLGAAIPPEDLARMTVPTALIWGRHDLGIPLRIAQAASERHGWPLHVIEGARDDPAIEQPDDFVAALRSALDA